MLCNMFFDHVPARSYVMLFNMFFDPCAWAFISYALQHVLWSMCLGVHKLWSSTCSLIHVPGLPYVMLCNMFSDPCALAFMCYAQHVLWSVCMGVHKLCSAMFLSHVLCNSDVMLCNIFFDPCALQFCCWAPQQEHPKGCTSFPTINLFIQFPSSYIHPHPF
jgi:hypothetical protein